MASCEAKTLLNKPSGTILKKLSRLKVCSVFTRFYITFLAKCIISSCKFKSLKLAEKNCDLCGHFDQQIEIYFWPFEIQCLRLVIANNREKKYWPEI
jgi:hypothetical protein